MPTVYQCCVDNNGREIEQELRLRRIPIDLTLRVTPLGPSSPVQVYFGGGVSLISWRYSETGDFIDFNNDDEVFHDQFVGSGTEAGGVALGGVRFQGRSATGRLRGRGTTRPTPTSTRTTTSSPARASTSAAGRYQGTVGLPILRTGRSGRSGGAGGTRT